MGMFEGRLHPDGQRTAQNDNSKTSGMMFGTFLGSAPLAAVTTVAHSTVRGVTPRLPLPLVVQIRRHTTCRRRSSTGARAVPSHCTLPRPCEAAKPLGLRSCVLQRKPVFAQPLLPPALSARRLNPVYF